MLSALGFDRKQWVTADGDRSGDYSFEGLLRLLVVVNRYQDRL